MSNARYRLPVGLGDLLRSEMTHCIEEANLGRDDTVIATRYLVDQWPQIDIAAEMGWTRSTVSSRIPRIVEKVEKAAKKMRLA